MKMRDMNFTTRRAFVGGGIAFLADSLLAVANPSVPVRGLVLNVRDLRGKLDWPKLAHESNINTLATHFAPADVMPFIQSDFGRRFLEGCAKYDIHVEHELHALDYLLPRDLFAKNPELFRMDEKGIRQQKSNGCFSNPQTLEIVAEKAVEVAKVCKSTTGRYYYWMSDCAPACQCPKCRGLTHSDQAVLVENVIVKALRREIDPKAMLSHLAYERGTAVPQNVKPHEGLFLEFAPVFRWRRNHGPFNREDLPEGCDHLQQLDDLLKLFPASTAQVLEYWLDESLYCYYKKPLRPLVWEEERTRKDVEAYAKRGIRNFTMFACMIDDDYVKEFGMDSLKCFAAYGKLLQNCVR